MNDTLNISSSFLSIFAFYNKIKCQIDSGTCHLIYGPQYNVEDMFLHFFSCVHATLQPALSVRRSHFTFFYDFLFVWPHYSCPHGLVTSNMAPAHPHPTSVAVYLALFL